MRKAWFLWRNFHGKPYPVMIYDDLPQSHDNTRENVGDPIPLKDEDHSLTLMELVKKFPYPKGEKK